MESNNRQKLEGIFADAKMIEDSLEGGESKERAMLKKEAKRMLEEAKNFEKSKADSQSKLMKVAFGLAGGFFLLSILLGFALAAMAPLKTVEPYLLEVDSVNHEVTIRRPLDKPVVSQGEEVDKFFIAEYVRAREGYDWGLAQRNYDTVKSYSDKSGSVFAEYDNFIKSSKSPLEILAENARVVVDINSITLDERTSTATVRFAKTVIARDGKPSIMIPTTWWIATLSYGYPNPKLKPEERRLNPLGMVIPSYQLVQERGRG